MTPESKKLLARFESALKNEVIYGEGEFVKTSSLIKYNAATQAARSALEAHIEQLEGNNQP